MVVNELFIIYAQYQAYNEPRFRYKFKSLLLDLL